MSPRHSRYSGDDRGAGDRFVDDPEEFAAASRAVDAICEEIGRDPREIERTAHLVVRLSNPEGLPIDPLPDHLRIIEGGIDEVAARLHAFADAGADEVMLIVDPARPAAIEELARAVEGIRGPREALRPRPRRSPER